MSYSIRNVKKTHWIDRRVLRRDDAMDRAEPMFFWNTFSLASYWSHCFQNTVTQSLTITL